MYWPWRGWSRKKKQIFIATFNHFEIRTIQKVQLSLEEKKYLGKKKRHQH